MRKVTLLTAVLLCFGLVGAFGQDDGMMTTTGVEFSISGNASATWGVDLDEGNHGFSNSAEFDLEWTLVEETTEEKGEGTVYGYIQFDGFAVNFDPEFPDDNPGNALNADTYDSQQTITVTSPEITAHVKLGPAYLDVTTEGVSPDEASLESDIAQNIITPVSTLAGTWDGEFAGVALGFDAMGMATVELEISSQYDWAESDGTAPLADVNTTNAYILGLDAEITPMDPLTVDLESTMRFGYTGDGTPDAEDATPLNPGNPATLGLGVEYSLGAVVPDTDLVPFFGTDVKFENYGVDEDMTTDVEVSAGVNMSWASIGTDEDDETIFGEEAELSSGVGLGFTFLNDQQYVMAEDDILSGQAISTKLGFFEDDGDAGLLPMFGGAAILNYNQYLENEDLGGNYTEGLSQFGIGVEGNVTVGAIKPYLGIMAANDNLDDNDFGTTLNVGVELSMIPNTTFTIDYASGNLTADEDDVEGYGANHYNYAAALGQTTSDRLGTFSIDTEISY